MTEETESERREFLLRALNIAFWIFYIYIYVVCARLTFALCIFNL